MTAARAFLLEDVASDRELLRAIMAGAEVEVPAHSAKLDDAVGELTANPDGYDVVVIDLNVPDSRGLATLEKVRVAVPATPILVVTGDVAAAAGAVLAGAEDVVLKDRVGEDLQRTLVKVLQRRQRASSVQQMRAAGFQGSSAPLAVVGGDGQSFVANPALASLVGVEAAAGESVTMLFVAEDRVEVAAAIAEVPHTGDGTAWVMARLATPSGPREQYVRVQQVHAGDMTSLTFSDDAQ